MTEPITAADAAPALTPAVEATLVRGVNLDHVNLTVLNQALAEAKLKVTAKTKVEDRVIMLADHDAKLIGAVKEKGGACDKCGGISLLARPHCPYCGTGDEQPMPTAPAAKPAPRSRKEAAAAKTEANQKAAAKATKGKPKKPAKPTCASWIRSRAGSKGSSPTRCRATGSSAAS